MEVLKLQNMKQKRMAGYLMQAALLIVFLVLGYSQVRTNRIHSEVPFETIETELVENLDENIYPQKPSVTVRRYIDLNPDQYEQIAFYRSDDAMSAGELLLVRFSNEEAADQFKEAVQKRIDTQHDIYSGYAPEQAAMMENALTDVQGNYALYYIGSDPENMESLFEQALKGGSGA